MDFKKAVKNYQADPTKENMRKQAAALTTEMSLDEKIYRLLRHYIKNVLSMLESAVQMRRRCKQ